MDMAFKGNYNLPLYTYAMKAWLELFGSTVLSFRFFSALIGVMSIFVIYKMGTVIFNKKIGLLASFLLAISPLHIFYSQEVGVYSLFLFLVLLFMFFLFKLIQKDDLRVFIGLFLCAISLLLTHYCSFFLLLSLLPFFLIKAKEKSVYLKTFLLLGGILFAYTIGIIIWWSKVINKDYSFSTISWIKEHSFLEMLYILFGTFSYGGVNFGGNDVRASADAIFMGNIVALIFVIFLIIALFSKKAYDLNSKLILFLWLFGVVGCCWAFSILFFPIFVPRYYIFSLGAFYLFVSKGLFCIKNKPCRLLIIAIIVLLMFFPLKGYYESELKMPWNEVVEYLKEENISSKDIVIFNPFFQCHVLSYNLLPFYGKWYRKIVPVSLFKEIATCELPRSFTYPNNDSNFYDSITISLFQGKRLFLIQSRWCNTFQRMNKYHPFSYWDDSYSSIDVRNYFKSNFRKGREIIFNDEGAKVKQWDNFGKCFYDENGVYIGIFYLNKLNN
jgi:hypothetical protein